MSDKDLMLLLPEVAYLIDRIPIARAAVKPNAVHLRFFQHARDTRMPLKEQCAALDVPWCARKVSAERVSKEMLKVARALPAAVFSQTHHLPLSKEDITRWCAGILNGSDWTLPAHSVQWLAFHAHEFDGMSRITIYKYLRDTKSLKASVAVAEVERAASRNYHDDLYRGGSFVMFDPRGRMSFDSYVPQRLMADRSPVNYPDRIKEPMQSGPHTVSLCYKPEHFRAAGEELQNCISDTGSSGEGLILFSSKVNYFDRVKKKQCHIATVSNEESMVAAIEFSPDWSITSVKAAKNKDVTDPGILVAANAFANLAKRNIAVGLG